MHPMILDVDLDGVCANYSAGLKQYLIDTHQLDPHAHVETNQYTFTKQDGWPFDNADDYLNAHTNAERHHLYRHLPMIEHANTGLKRLAENGVHIRIVTHRLFVSGQHRIVVSDTAKWLDDNGIPYMSLCFAGLKDSIQATVHIDDSPSNVNVLRKVGQHVVVFDQPYNRGLSGPRMTDWSDRNVDRLLEWFERWPDEQ